MVTMRMKLQGFSIQRETVNKTNEVNTEVEVDTVKCMQIDLENLRLESSFRTPLLG